jgi:hypothetical protein
MSVIGIFHQLSGSTPSPGCRRTDRLRAGDASEKSFARYPQSRHAYPAFGPYDTLSPLCLSPRIQPVTPSLVFSCIHHSCTPVLVIFT